MKIKEWLIWVVAGMSLLSLAACAGKVNNQEQQSVSDTEDTLELLCPCCGIDREEEPTGFDTAN